MKFGADDRWHRPMFDIVRRVTPGVAGEGTRTACNSVVTSYYNTREASADHPLCTDGCFSPAELEAADEWERTKADHEAAESARMEAEADERERERAATRAENRRRLEIATGKHPKVDPPEDE
ncbi:MAG TPA: hypothetical protein VFD36_29265 [Kofleriaceae bacterium]|nr:hypothetical protein [Kofleriaceae bacterium]